MTTVAICDVEPIAIEGLRAFLESPELHIVAGETSLAKGMDAARELKPSLLIAEKSFGVQAIINWLSSLRKDQPNMAIMVWSSAISEVDTIRILQAGVQGVLRKSSSLRDLMSCIRAVTAGETWVDEKLLGDFGKPARQSRSPLTVREEQVMDLVERGMKNREIGAELGIQTGTVKIHLKHIFEKTGIRGRYGLAISALREKGLLAAAVS